MTDQVRKDLVACPTCGCKDEAHHKNLGIRDYKGWLAGVLPGRVSGSDIDTVLDQSKTGRMLAAEYKPLGETLPLGQRLLLKALKKRDIDVWVVWQDFKGSVEVGDMDATGNVSFVQKMTERQLGIKMRKWWDAGLDEH